MLQMGLEAPLLEAGGGWCRRIIGYSEDVDPVLAEETAVPLAAMVPGSPGGFCVGHPQASEALNTKAAACGATVRRGVGAIEVTTGGDPRIRYEHDGVTHEVACRVVVGADGRHSLVRRALDIDRHVVESKATLGGMLVRAILRAVPDLRRLRLSSIDAAEIDDELVACLDCGADTADYHIGGN